MSLVSSSKSNFGALADIVDTTVAHLLFQNYYLPTHSDYNTKYFQERSVIHIEILVILSEEVDMNRLLLPIVASRIGKQISYLNQCMIMMKITAFFDCRIVSLS